MPIGLFSLSLESDKPVLSVRESANCSVSEILNRETNFRRTNWFFCPFQVKLGAVGSGTKPTARDFISTEWLTFDIDGIDTVQDECRELPIRVMESSLKLDEHGERHYVWTGHGIQAFFRIPAQNKSFFSGENTTRYKRLCEFLSNEFLRHDFAFKEIDSRVFEPSRLHRLPGTINHKSGKAPVRAELIESVNDSSSIPNQGLLDFLFSFQGSVQQKREISSDKIKNFLEDIGGVERGNYWLLPCPWHKESKPSFAFYPDTGMGYDFHETRESWNFSRTLEQIYAKVAENEPSKAENSKESYKKQFGLEAFKPAEDIILGQLEEMGPTHSIRGEVFFSQRSRCFSRTSVSGNYSREIIEKVITESDEFPECRSTYSKRMTDFDVGVKIYNQFFPIAWGKLISKLPEETRTEKETITSKEHVRRCLKELLAKPMVFSEGIEKSYTRTESIRSKLKQAPDSWERFGCYEIFLRNDNYHTDESIDPKNFGIAIRFEALAFLSKALYGSFPSSKIFAAAIRKMGFGTSGVIKAEGSPHRVCLLDIVAIDDDEGESQGE